MPLLPPPHKLVTRPYSKLTLLVQEARRRSGTLTTFAAVAGPLAVTPQRVSHLFGHGNEKDGLIVQTPETLGHLENLVTAFTNDGVTCEIDWFYLDYPNFAARIGGSHKEKAPPREPPAEWERREGSVLVDLVELRLEPPRPANEPPDTYYIDATLQFGTAQVDVDPVDEDDDPRIVAIALREARLAIGSDGYRPLRGTLVGERDGTRDSPNYRHRAGGIDITGPALNGTLDGDPIGDRHLAVIAGTNAGEEELAVSVAALRGSFVVSAVDLRSSSGALVPLSINKNAILNAFIYSKSTARFGSDSRDDANRVVLARATLRRRPEDGNSA